MTKNIDNCQCRFIKVSHDQTSNTSDSKRACNIANKIDINKTTDKKLLISARVHRQNNNCKSK